MKINSLLISALISSSLFGGNIDIPLSTGWNAIGTNSNMVLDDIKTELGSSLLNIQSPDGKKTYNATSTKTQTFVNFETGVGYWIKVSNDTSLTVTELDFASDQTISMVSGWNLIDPLTNMTLADIQTQLGSSLLNIQSPDGKKTYNAASTKTQSFVNFEAGVGYWIKLNSSADLIFSFSSSIIENPPETPDLNSTTSTTTLSGPPTVPSI